MTEHTTRRHNDGEVLSGVQRRKRWPPKEKVRLVEETYAGHERIAGRPPPRHWGWPTLHLTAVDGPRRADRSGCRRGNVFASEYRALQAQGSELQRLLGKKTMEAEILHEAVFRAAGSKNCCCARPRCRGRSVTAVANAFGISRQHLSAMRNRPLPQRRGRPPLPDAELIAGIRMLVADLPTYGYCRVHALLRRQARQTGHATPNPKRVYRVMKVHGLLLRPHGGKGEERRRDGGVAVDRRNTRWSSDTLEIGCDNGERSASPLRLTAATGRPWGMLPPPPAASPPRTSGT